MNPVDASNPYQAPEASIADLRGEVRRPLIYTAVSMFSWIIGALGFVLSGGFAFVVGRLAVQYGWRRVFLSTIGLRVVSEVVLVLLATLCYIVAGRLLWARRGRPGMILCSAAIVMTYLAAWLYTKR